MLFGTQKILSNGHLEVGGCDVVSLAREFGTPLYILDEAFVRQRMREYRQAFESRYPKVAIAFAGKAFLTLTMAKIVEQEGLHLDVASAGELFTALSAGFPVEHIQMHGNNKSVQELEMALDNNVGRIIVDNLLEIDRIIEMAERRGVVPNLILRVAPGIDPKTHRRIQTGQEDTKFGFNIRNGSALEGARKCIESKAVHFSGIHCHVGSQLMDAESHQQAADIMCGCMRQIEDTTGQRVEELNMGGGLGIRYVETHHPISVDEYAGQVVTAVEDGLREYGLEAPILSQEPGRSIIGQAGITVYEVGAIKNVPIPEAPGTRTYVNIDGGMSDNPRPQLYDAVYEAFLANKADQPRNTTVRIAGKHCETDILIQETSIQEPEPGDILAVQGTGAYNYTMASNYNRLPRPAVVLVNNGQADIIVRRETLEDLVSQDVIPQRLLQPETTAV
ncbi:MAG: diaminopimelate decarboxylase [Armatimonadota bacterium]